MRILIDTNIYIPLEDSGIELNEKVAELNRLSSGKHQLLVHPASYEDIERDKDEARRRRMLSRLSKYINLESAPVLNSELEVQLFGLPKKPNDTVDNSILYALHKDCSHWLVTEDLGIHKKSKLIGEAERVLTVDQAIAFLSNLDSIVQPIHPYIEDMPCHAIDITNSVFDSLRNGYPGFDVWFKKGAQEGRRAWVCKTNEQIQAFCIYKIEQDEIVTCDNKALPGKLLKLCSFKVLKHGVKLGELMLKQAFNYADDNLIDYVYLTVEPNRHHQLDALLADFGFRSYGIDKKGRDIVLEKPFFREAPEGNEDELEYAVRNYPAIKLDSNTAYLVPIKPQYHKTLFPEIQHQADLFSESNNSAGNAIKQAYLCRSPTKSIKPGDILFFYRTHDEKTITTYGVVDQFVIESEPEKIYQWVAKRTVYSYEDVQEMSGNQIRVVLFRKIRHLSEPISYKLLKEIDIVKGPIQSITSLSTDDAITLIQEAKIHDCFISN